MPDETVPEPDPQEGTPASFESLPFPVVGIGASAGGLEAVTGLLGHIPERPGMAFVLIQHLDPARPSHLVEILSRHARFAVVEAEDDMPVEADRLYVIPPNANLGIHQGRLKVSPRTEMRGAHLPVDYFFRSLAEEAQGKAIGVVLSGSGTDGSFGLAEIKAAGGITFAQDEQSAKHSAMPKSAIEEGVVDFALPPQEIARELLGMGSHPYFSQKDGVEDGKIRVGSEEDFHRILMVLRSFSGVDFAHYRDTTLKRRILRRMAVHKVDHAETYQKLLKEDRGEVAALYQDVLINVTRFFRNPGVFEALKAGVFPEIHKNKSPGASIRLWVAGCSTGEEAYSLAMSLVEFQDTQQLRPPIRVFASDISETPSLERARLGIYSDSIEADVSPERLRRFFAREGKGYKINQDIRDMCVFARHNVAADPPFSRMDLIACRNVLIYLSPHLQRKVLPTFHYALNPVGFLVLGTSETVGRDAELYNVVDPKHKIYAKKVTAVRGGQHFFMPEFTPKPMGTSRAVVHSASPVDYEKAADRILLRRFSPAGILINRDLEILQFRGRTSPYLEPPQGDPSFKLVKMAAETLFLEIRGAIREADQKNATVHRPGVKVRDGNNIRDVDLEILPVRPADSGEGCFLVLFEDGESSRASGQAAAAPGIAHSEADEVAHLRLELAAAREYLKTIREQYDTVNEELTSSNEEILSSNEELQSTNEELETAKEELQSTNEELTTLNDELRVRNIELSQANNDLNNLFASIGLPIVMLGSDVRIRRFTPAAGKTLRLTPADIGRHLNDINTGIGAADLDRDVLTVLDTVAPITREIQDRDGRWHALRVHPYRTADNKIDGAVLILLDIDQVKQADRDLKIFKFMSDQSPFPQLLVTREGNLYYANRSAHILLGHEGGELPKRRYAEIDPAYFGTRFTQLFENGFLAGTAQAFETVFVAKSGRKIPVECTATGVQNEGDRLLLIMARDLTEAKRISGPPP